MKNAILLLASFFIVFAAAAQVPSYVPTNGLVGYWPFNGNANDESGNGNNGVVNGATLTNDRFGNLGKAYSFDGNGDSIVISNIMYCQSYTVSAWFKYDQLTTQYPHIYNLLTSLENNRLHLYGTAYTNINQGKILSGDDYNGNSFITSNISSGVWHNIVVVFDYNLLKHKIYLDGIYLGQSSLIGVSTFQGKLKFGNGFTQQPNSQPNDSKGFVGPLDDIGIWNRALSQSEITSLYNSGTNSCIPSYLPTNGLVGWWPFCGNANDVSGNGNNGVVNGATLTSDRFGEANSSYYFNGTSNYIRLNNLFNGISGATSATYNCWALKSVNSSNEGVLVSQWVMDATPSGPIGLFYNIASNNTMSAAMIGGYGFSSTQPALNTSNWNMYTVVYDYSQQLESNRFKFYQNGNLLSLNTSTNLVPSSIGNLSNIASIGARGFQTSLGSINGFFAGKIDDVAIYNRPLTQSEITTLYNNSFCNLNPTLFSQDTIKACGASYSLNAGSGYTTYLWNTGATTQTINATNTGWYKCTVSNGTCTGADSVFVSIVNANIVNNDTAICRGASIVLNAGSVIPAPVVDINGNVYPTVNIGSQTWMQKNLNVSKYKNGDVIPQVTDAAQWAALTTGAWCWYNNDSATYAATYGKLYNWYAVNDPRGLATQGWHISTDGDWLSLSNFYGGLYAAGALKESGTSHWSSPNTAATNVSNFSALPGGYCNGTFDGIKNIGLWWASDDFTPYTPSFWLLSNNDSMLINSVNLFAENGLSILAVRDATTYIWSNGATTQSITISPTQTTTYYCNISNGISSCIDSVTVYVRQHTTSTTNTSICSNQLPYLWNGLSYNQSGSYNKTLTNAAGCDSIATLNLTIKQTSSSTTTATTCGSYLWNGVTYTSSGTYTKVTTNAVGCDSIATLNLTLTSATNSAPSAITGARNISRCDTLQNYSVLPMTGVTFTWTVTGTGNSVKTGQGTNAVVLVMKVAGTISVKATNACGTVSAATTLAVTKATPATPGTISQ